MAQLVESIEGLAEAAEFFEVPITGGNVTVYPKGSISPYVVGKINHEGSGLSFTGGHGPP